MEILFIVLNQENHLEMLLEEFNRHEIRGGTILESQGFASTMIEHVQEMGYGYLRTMLNDGRPYNKTIFLILNDDKLRIAKECVRRVIGDMNRENRGIMFTIPLSSVEGLTK